MGFFRSRFFWVNSIEGFSGKGILGDFFVVFSFGFFFIGWDNEGVFFSGLLCGLKWECV